MLSATGRVRTSWLPPVNAAPPFFDTDRTIALWQAPAVLTPVYRFPPVVALTPAGVQPFASFELRLM